VEVSARVTIEQRYVKTGPERSVVASSEFTLNRTLERLLCLHIADTIDNELLPQKMLCIVP
jgi:hypothetical protein